jgi:hypothetical protein
MSGVPTPEDIAAYVRHREQMSNVAAWMQMSWPFNARYGGGQPPADKDIAKLIRGFLRNPPDDGYATMKPGTAYIVWLAGYFTPLPPNIVVEDMARRNAPWLGECDRCKRMGVDGYDDDPETKSLLLVPLIPEYFWVFGFVLCPKCSYDLSQNEATHLIYHKER